MSEEFEFIYVYFLYRTFLAKPENLNLEYDRQMVQRLSTYLNSMVSLVQRNPDTRYDAELNSKIAGLIQLFSFFAMKRENTTFADAGETYRTTQTLAVLRDEQIVISRPRLTDLRLRNSYVFIEGKMYRQAPESFLGQGAFGAVHKVTDIEGEEYALKSEKTTRAHLASPQAESSKTTLRQAGQLLAYSQRQLPMSEDRKDVYDTETFKLMPLVKGIPFSKVISEHLGQMTKSQKYALLEAISLALQELHDRNIIHCDIKPENVLITYDIQNNRLKAKFIDLDFGMVLAPGQDVVTLTTQKGTQGYMAPEIVAYERTGQAIYSYASDVYALGSIIVQDYYGCTIPSDMPEDEKRFLKSLRSADSANRPTLAQTIEFFKDKKLKAQDNGKVGKDRISDEALIAIRPRPAMAMA